MACTPEGFIMDAFEFMGAESCSQRYLFLARLKQCYPVLNVVLHDDACHLRRFADARAAFSSLASSVGTISVLVERISVKYVKVFW